MNNAIYPIINEENGLPFIVCGIGSQPDQCHIIRNEGYHIHQIIFSTSGSGILKVNQKEYKINRGSYFYLKPHEFHEYYKQTENWATDWILFTGENIHNTLNKLGFTESKSGSFQFNNNIKNIFNDIMVTLNGNDSLKGYIASSLLYRLLIEIYKSSIQEIESNNTQVSIIQPIINYIDMHFSEDISLEALSDIADITPQHLCKVFRKCLYMRPFEYIAKKRIQEAKKLLIDRSMSVKAIGEAVGYKDSSYFSAIFKKHELISPADFRGSAKSFGFPQN